MYSKKGKGRGTTLLPSKPCSTTDEGCQAGGLGHLLQYMRDYSTMPRPKTGQEKVQFYCEDDLLFLSSYYLSMIYNIMNGMVMKL